MPVGSSKFLEGARRVGRSEISMYSMCRRSKSEVEHINSGASPSKFTHLVSFNFKFQTT
jgi:hypothetical protein